MKYFMHYKNKPYRMLGEAKHSETLEDVVIYECLYENPTAKVWVRPKQMFFENVTVEGKSVPRFKEIATPDESMQVARSNTVATPGSQEMYAIFCGDINSGNMQKLTAGLAAVMQMNISRLHLMFQTWGGFAGDGVYLYNLFKQLPLDIVIYNAGQVASAGAIAFLGAKCRKTTSNAIFMIHRAQSSPPFSNATKLKSASDGLALEDERTKEILAKHLQLPKELLDQLENHDVYISGKDAVNYGFADEIAEFAPPPGTKVLNALG